MVTHDYALSRPCGAYLSLRTTLHGLRFAPPEVMRNAVPAALGHYVSVAASVCRCVWFYHNVALAW